MLKEVLKKYWPGKLAFLLIVLLIAIRLINLANSPIGINHDELEVMLSSRSGLLFPQALFFTNTEAGLAALPSFLMFFFRFIPLNMLTSRLVFLLLNLATGVLLSVLVYKFTKIKMLSIICFLLFLVNPWSFLLSRSLTEAPFALFFTLLGILFLFSLKANKIFYSITFFIAAFLSYQGTKVIIPPLVIALIFLHWKFIGCIKIRTYVAYVGIFGCLVLGYFIIAFLYPESTVTSRSGEFIFLNLDRYTKIVDDARMRTIDFPLTNLFVNKYTYLIKDFAQKYFGLFSPDLLFFKGDPRSTYTLGEHGLLYLPDFIFIITGIFGLGKILKNKLLGWIIFLLALLAPLGASLSLIENSYIFRTSLILPVFIVLTALGIYIVFLSLPQKLGKLFLVTVTAIYFILFINFLFVFFISFPVKQQENQYFSERVVVNYMLRNQKSNKKIVAIVHSPYQIMNQYLFFSNNNSPGENLILSNNCIDLERDDIVIIQSGVKCPEPNEQKKVIQDQKDSGELYQIYNDQLCQNISHTSYNRFHFFSDYNVENLSDEQFCNRLINQYD